MKPRTLVLLTGAIVLMSACGSKTSSTSTTTTTSSTSSGGTTATTAQPASQLKPCSVLTQSEVQGIVRNNVQPGTDTGGGDGCFFGANAGDTTFLLNIEQKDSQAKFDDSRDNARLQTPNVSTVQGIGDEAFTYVPKEGNLASAESRVGTVRVRVVMTGSHSTAEAAKSALETVVSRVKS